MYNYIGFMRNSIHVLVHALPQCRSASTQPTKVTKANKLSEPSQNRIEDECNQVASMTFHSEG